MITLKDGSQTEHRRLDRVPSATDEHIQKYPLTAEHIAELTQPTPMAIGINWYSAFFIPEFHEGHWWVGLGDNIGQIEGGHCVCLKNRRITDDTAWWDYYNQGEEGRCVQFGVSRMMTLLNRKRYEIRADDPQGHWLYWEAQKADEWDGGAYPGASPQYEGTSVNAALNVVRKSGLIRYRASEPDALEGIQTFRWARSYNDVKKALGYEDVGYVDILNSWGRDYPHLVRMPDDVGARLLQEDGEFGIVTDR